MLWSSPRMPRLFSSALLLCLAASAASAQERSPDPAQFMPWQVVDRVVSGNIIDVRGAGFVRLAGIDDSGDSARAFLSGILSSQAVRVLASTYSSDGMTEGFVFTADGRCVNVEMLRYGYARVRITPGFEREAEFRGLQADAQRLQRGLWAPPPPPPPAPPSARRRDVDDDNAAAMKRFHISAGGGSTTDGRREWSAMADAGVRATRALGLYISAGHAGSQTMHGSAGIRLTSPARFPIVPYVRAGGGYMRIDRSDRPFWEAGGGVLVLSGPLQVDLGYTFARARREDVTRVFGLLGLRF